MYKSFFPDCVIIIISDKEIYVFDSVDLFVCFSVCLIPKVLKKL